MSEINFDCPLCGQNLDAPSDMEGEVIECPACDKPIRIPVTAPASGTIKLKKKVSTQRSPAAIANARKTPVKKPVAKKPIAKKAIPKKKKKKKKTKTGPSGLVIFLVLLVVIASLVGGYFGVMYMINKKYLVQENLVLSHMKETRDWLYEERSFLRDWPNHLPSLIEESAIYKDELDSMPDTLGTGAEITFGVLAPDGDFVFLLNYFILISLEGLPQRIQIEDARILLTQSNGAQPSGLYGYDGIILDLKDVPGLVTKLKNKGDLSTLRADIQKNKTELSAYLPEVDPIQILLQKAKAEKEATK